MTEAGEDLAALLAGQEPQGLPERGDLLEGHIISIDSSGMIVDLGLKRDGVVMRSDLERLHPEEAQFQVGDPIAVMVIAPVDSDGNLLVSVAQARESSDWIEARRLMEADEILEAAPSGYNKGGLIVPFGRLQGFVPASHLSNLPRGLEEEERMSRLADMVGTAMPFKIIEVDPQRRRLVLSERKAVRQWRQDKKKELIESLKEGEVRTGVVTSLREFGAFVDIGGADGLIHISEIDWRRIEDPGKMLSVGQEVETLVIRLDKESNRIGLSLKRLQPNPWEAAAGTIEAGQVLEGEVSLLTSKGAYINIGDNLEGFLQVSDGGAGLVPGVKVSVRVVEFDPGRERLDLELLPEES